MERKLRFEELEERIAPTVIGGGDTLEFTDGDGDTIRISYEYDGPDGSQVVVLDDGGTEIDNGDTLKTIGTITVTDSNMLSVLSVQNLGGGSDNDTIIEEGVFYTTAGASTGKIALGVSEDGSAAGTVTLGASARIMSAGRLDVLVLNGDIDFDTADHSIVAAYDIGLVEIRGDMALDSGTDVADITAGGDGTGNISFIRVDGDILDATGGTALPWQNIGTGVTVQDDAGDGNDGTLVVRVSGTGAMGLVRAIPVVGGGTVLSMVTSDGATGITIAAAGLGGDVTDVYAIGATTSLTISGTADTDLYFFSADVIGTVYNRTIGGDIVAVESDGAIGSILTTSRGMLGSAGTSTLNSYPMVIGGEYIGAGETSAVGTIGRISVGGVTATTITADSLTTLTAIKGGMNGVNIDVSGTIGRITTSYISESDISGTGGINYILARGDGIFSTDIISDGTIGTISTRGSIVGTKIIAEFEDGVGYVGSIIAGEIYASEFKSLGGFGRISVSGTIAGTEIDAVFAGGDGGAIGYLQANGITAGPDADGILVGSDISAVSIGTVNVGSGGVNWGSTIDSATTISRVIVRGDVSDGSKILADDGITSVFIAGDLAYYSSIGYVDTDLAIIDPVGPVGSLVIGGEIISSTVWIDGDVTRFSAGGITGINSIIGISGDVVSFNINGDITGQDRQQAAEDDPSAVIQIDGHVSRFNVRGGMTGANVGIYDGVGAMSFGGSLSKGEIKIYGDPDPSYALQSLSVRGDINLTDITIGNPAESLVTVGRIYVGGSVHGLAADTLPNDSSDGPLFEIHGNVGNMAVRGSGVNTWMVVDGDVGALSFGRGLYVSTVTVEGSAGRFTAGNSVQRSETLFYGGIDNYTVRGSINFSNVGTTYYDGSGNPQGDALGNVSAYDINNSAIYGNAGIGSVKSRGVIYDTDIEAVGRDDYGDVDTGAITGGGSIGLIQAKGLVDTSVLAYTDIDYIRLSGEGINGDSEVMTVGGDLGTIWTRGLISGFIMINGDITGSILTGGDQAPLFGGAYYFLDANGVITGGAAALTGTLGGIIS